MCQVHIAMHMEISIIICAMCMLKNQETAMRAPDESKKSCSKTVLSELHVLDEKRYNSYINNPTEVLHK